MLVLFVVLFAWIALAFTSALGGLVDMLTQRQRGDDEALPALSTRTALLMPCYNEQPARIAAGLQAIYESLEATGRLDHFDFFILSDTTVLMSGSRRKLLPRPSRAHAAAPRAFSIGGAPRTPSARRATSPIGCAASAAPTRRCSSSTRTA